MERTPEQRERFRQAANAFWASKTPEERAAIMRARAAVRKRKAAAAKAARTRHKKALHRKWERELPVRAANGKLKTYKGRVDPRSPLADEMVAQYERGLSCRQVMEAVHLAGTSGIARTLLLARGVKLRSRSKAQRLRAGNGIPPEVEDLVPGTEALQPATRALLTELIQRRDALNRLIETIQQAAALLGGR